MKLESNRFAATVLLLPMLLFFSSLVRADEDPAWVKCARIEPEKQLECYAQATESYLAKKQQTASSDIKAAPTAVPQNTPQKGYDWKLDHLWPVGDEWADTKALAGVLIQHRRKNLLFDSDHTLSDAPTSPNPLNRVPASAQPKTSELNLQVSVKARLPIVWPWGDSVWLAYTQQSHWQSFNGNDSRPFRETNYEPEFIYLSHRFSDQVPTFGAWTPRVLNLSYVHQSNGQALPRSRSWNRFTAQLGSEYRFDDTDDQRLTVNLRPWWRVPDGGNNDDNPDIVHYLGHGDLTLDYWRGRDQYSILLRERAFQLSWSMPLYLPSMNSVDFYIHYFSGYGLSLIDYNHKLHSLAMGISLPF